MNEKNIPVPKPHQRGTQGAMNTWGVGGWPMFLRKVHLSHSVSLKFSWLKIIWNIKLAFSLPHLSRSRSRSLSEQKYKKYLVLGMNSKLACHTCWSPSHWEGWSYPRYTDQGPCQSSWWSEQHKYCLKINTACKYVLCKFINFLTSKQKIACIKQYLTFPFSTFHRHTFYK